MKRLIFCCVLVLFQLSLFAQVRLDVEGDAKIVGDIALIKAVGDSSLFIGANAGENDVPGSFSNRNTFVGTNTGQRNTHGEFNSFFGYNTGLNNTTGLENSFFGYAAGRNNTNGTANSFFGNYVGGDNSSGFGNSFFGYFTGGRNTEGSYNSFFGYRAGNENTTGNFNSFFGDSAGYANTTGENNAFYGNAAGLNNRTGSNNSFFGFSAGNGNRTGMENSFFGYRAGRDNTNGTANSFFGSYVGGDNSSGFGNSFFGYFTGGRNTEGSYNSFFGYRSGNENTTGDFNSFFGESAGYASTTGAYNAFFGNAAGLSNRTGSSNSFFGFGAGRNNRTGADNVFLGYEAGVNSYRGINNTFVGVRSGHISTLDSLDHAIAIGYEAEVDCHNCAAIGGTGSNAVNVGIGINTPTDRLHVYEAGKASIRLNTTLSGITSLKLYESADFGFEIMNNGLTNKLFFHAFQNGTLTPMAQWDRNGYFINHGSANIRGSIFHNGSLIHSDRRYKKQIQPIQKSIERLHRINGVSYAYKSKEYAARNFSSKRTLGLIAQEVEKVFPELVQENEEGYKAVNYDGLIPVLIEATKAQQQLINEQKETLEIQTNQLTDQQQQIDELKGLVNQLLAASTAPQKTNNHTFTLGKTASLEQNQPNPFGETTLVNYYVPENTQNASLQVTSLNGKVLGITQLIGTGHGQVNIQAHTFPAGTYYYSLVVDGQVVATKKMVLANR